MGFLPDVETIIKRLPENRQTLLFSATISFEVNRLAQKYMHKPIDVEAESYVDPNKLSQYYYGPVEDSLKFSLLVHLLKQNKKESIFIKFQEKVDQFIFSELKASYVSISLPPGLLDLRPFKWNGYTEGLSYDYIFNLDNDTDYIWGQFKRKLRGDINRAKNRGDSIEYVYKKDLDFIYNSLVRRCIEQGITLSIPKKYLYEIYAESTCERLKLYLYSAQLSTLFE